MESLMFDLNLVEKKTVFKGIHRPSTGNIASHFKKLLEMSDSVRLPYVLIKNRYHTF